MRPLTLALLLVLAPLILYRRCRRQASDLDLALLVYFVLATLGFWFFPDGLGRLMTGYAITVLYIVLCLAAALPPLLGAAPFTIYFARRTTPAAVWDTDLFQEINRRLTVFWASLFGLSALVSLAPHLWPTPGWSGLFDYVLPLLLLFGVGFPLTRWYPGYRQRCQGLIPPAPEE
jgi:hypothetical protein